ANITAGVSPADSGDGTQSESSESAGPQVVLKIRRRKFQQQFKAGELSVTRRLFRWRQRVSAKREALPIAGYPGIIHGNGARSRELRSNRAGPHWANLE